MLAVAEFTPLFMAVLICWIFSVCIHEFAHALVAYLGGDTSHGLAIKLVIDKREEVSFVALRRAKNGAGRYHAHPAALRRLIKAALLREKSTSIGFHIGRLYLGTSALTEEGDTLHLN